MFTNKIFYIIIFSNTVKNRKIKNNYFRTFKYFNSLHWLLLLFKISTRLATQFFVTKNIHIGMTFVRKKEGIMCFEEMSSQAMDKLRVVGFIPIPRRRVRLADTRSQVFRSKHAN